MIFGTGGMIGFAVLAARRGERVLHPAILTPVLLIRCVFEVAGRLFYTLAIAFTPLSSASAILQATPLVVVMGAALIFGEKVGWRRWTAIAVGLRGCPGHPAPGARGVHALSLLAVLGHARLCGARSCHPRGTAGPVEPAARHLWLCHDGADRRRAAGAVSGGAVDARVPRRRLQLAAATVVGVAAYYALTVAMRTGEVSVVTPFRYTRLVFALILGVLVFGERPDAMTLLGSIIVVASGLYTLLRARRVTVLGRADIGH